MLYDDKHKARYRGSDKSQELKVTERLLHRCLQTTCLDVERPFCQFLSLQNLQGTLSAIAVALIRISQGVDDDYVDFG